MEIVTTKASVKVAAVATALAMASSMLSFAPAVHAASCSVGTADLTIGSKGDAVTCLQTTLVAGGYLVMPTGVAMGYFGPLTQSAVSKWQAAVGISPTAGYFGPLSRAKFAGSDVMTGGTSTVPGCTAGALFSSTTGQSCATATTVPGCVAGALFSSTTGQSCAAGTTSTAGLTGVGSLTNITTLGDLTTDLKEGSEAKNVVGVSAKATGGDVAIQRVDAVLTVGSSGSQSANINKYISDVSVYLDGTKIGSIDPSLGSKDGRTWTFRFSGLNGVIKSGKTGNIYVKVTPIDSVGTTEDGKGFTATIPADGVRGVAADGISDTYVTSAITTSGITVSSVTAATLTVSENASNPKASQVAVSSSTTTGVTLVTFNAKAKNQGVTIHDVKASFYTSDAINDVYSTVKLVKGTDSTGTVLSSKTVTGSGTYATATFDSIDQTVAKDETATYSIIADFKGDSAYADGTTVSASTTVAGWDVEDADGGSVTPSAAVAGNTQTLTATGITVVKGTITSTNGGGCGGTSGCGETGTYTIPFTVTAGDSDIYISGVASRGSSNTSAIRYATTSTSAAAVTGTATANFTADGTVTGDSAGAYYKVLAGTSRSFTLRVSLTASATGTNYTGVKLNGIAYGLTSSLGSAFTSNLDTFKTSPDLALTKY